MYMTVAGNGAEGTEDGTGQGTQKGGQGKGFCHFNEVIKNLLTFVGLSGRCQ